MPLVILSRHLTVWPRETLNFRQPSLSPRTYQHTPHPANPQTLLIIHWTVTIWAFVATVSYFPLCCFRK